MKKFLIYIFSVIILGSFSFQTKAEELAITKGSTLSLEECLNIAYEHNPNITLSQNSARVFQSRIGQEKAGYLPQINLSSGYSRQNPITNAPIDESNNQYSSNISLNQLLYDFGKTPLKSKIQKLNLQSATQDIDDKIIQVSFNVKQAYYSALTAKINRDIYAKSIIQYQNHLKQAKAFFSIGTKSKIDVTNAEVNLSNIKLNYIKSDYAYKTALSSLNNAMGLYQQPEYDVAETIKFKRPDKLFEKGDVTKNITLQKYNITLEEAVKNAFENRPDLKSLYIKENAAKESINLSKKDYYPTLSGFANYGCGGQKFPVDEGWSFGANLNLPVFNGLLTKNKVNEAKANKDVVLSNLEILKQNIYMQVQQAYITLKQAEKSIPVAEIAVRQAKENYELAEGRYNVGVGSSIEVNDAETSYNNAQLSYVQSFYDYNTAYINLERAMGVK